MKLLKMILFSGILFSLSINVYGQEELSLSKAINNALSNNYDIRIVRGDQRAAEVYDSWGAAGRFPTINFDLGSNNQSNYNEERDFTNFSINPGVSVNWILFDGFAIRIRKKKFEYLSELSRGNTALMVESTVQYVIGSYYNVLLHEEKLKVLDEVMGLSKDRYDYTLTKKEIGNAVTFDVLQAKNAWLEDKANFMFQEATYKNSIRDLNYLMGRTRDTTYTFIDNFTPPADDFEWEPLYNKMLHNNKSLRNQYIHQALLEKEIGLAKSLYYPSLSLRTGADAFRNRTQYDGLAALNSNTQNLFANLTLSFSLFDGGARRRALNAAKIQEEIGQIEISDMKHSLTIELAKLFELFNVRKNLFAVARENLEAAQLNMQISDDRFKAGTINSFNYRDIQLIYLNAALNRLNAIYDLIDTNTALMRITGGIVAEY